MRANYHCHSFYCGHAEGTVFDYVGAASDNNLDILAISDHAPFPGGFQGNGMDFSELDRYLSDIDEAASCFPKIKVLKSLEIEYLPEFEKGRNYYEWLLTEKKLDYLLLGEHFFTDENGEFHNIYCAESSDLVLDYAKACVAAMNTGFFKIMAHPDIFTMPPYRWDSRFDMASEMIIQAAEKNNVILEFNANGLRRGKFDYPDGKRYQYPSERFWKKVVKSSVSVVVGSDCHRPEQMWDWAVEKSYGILADIGISPVCRIF